MAVTYTIQGRLDGLNTFIYANRTNPYNGARCKKNNQKICKAYIPQWLKKKHIKFPVILEIKWYEKNKRRDPDNVFSAIKYILDSLVEVGVFPNDGQKQVEGIVNWIKVDAKNPRIEITIYEDGDKY